MPYPRGTKFSIGTQIGKYSLFGAAAATMDLCVRFEPGAGLSLVIIQDRV
jgi:hypothetical protein